MSRRFVLASASVARRRLLTAAGLPPEVVVSGLDESTVTAPTPGALARALAVAKARSVATRLSGDALVLGCDSLLELDGAGYGKPASPEQARERWTLMAGHDGVLHTGHCLLDLRRGSATREIATLASTTVRFGEPEPDELDAYLRTGEPLAVAGAFTLDGYGGWFVEAIDGDHGTVLGLSLPLLRRMLCELGVRVTDLWTTEPGA